MPIKAFPSLPASLPLPFVPALRLVLRRCHQERGSWRCFARNQPGPASGKNLLPLKTPSPEYRVALHRDRSLTKWLGVSDSEDNLGCGCAATHGGPTRILEPRKLWRCTAWAHDGSPVCRWAPSLKCRALLRVDSFEFVHGDRVVISFCFETRRTGIFTLTLFLQLLGFLSLPLV